MVQCSNMQILTNVSHDDKNGSKHRQKIISTANFHPSSAPHWKFHIKDFYIINICGPPTRAPCLPPPSTRSGIEGRWPHVLCLAVLEGSEGAVLIGDCSFWVVAFTWALHTKIYMSEACQTPDAQYSMGCAWLSPNLPPLTKSTKDENVDHKVWKCNNSIKYRPPGDRFLEPFRRV